MIKRNRKIKYHSKVDKKKPSIIVQQAYNEISKKLKEAAESSSRSIENINQYI